MIEVNDMNKKIIITVCAVLVLALLVTGSVLLFFPEKAPTEIAVREHNKTPILAEWPGYDFEGAIEEAHRIIIGTVAAKSETKKQEGYAGNILVREYYKDVTIDVESVLKGDADLETVNYIEPGGEIITINADGTASINDYEYEGIPTLAVGDRVLLYLTEKGNFLSPLTLFVINPDDTISVSSEVLTPDTLLKSQSHYMETYDLDDYVGAIKDYLAS